MVKPEFKPFSFIVDSAEPFRVISGNKRIIDFSGSAMTVGYNFIKPEWLVPTVSRPVYPNTYTSELTEMLRDISGYENVAYATSGSEACDAALSRFGKPIVALEGAYHGLTYLTYKVSNGQGYDKENNILHLKVPNTFLTTDEAISLNEELLKNLKTQNHSQGTLIMELVQSDGGVNILPREFIKYLFEVAERYNLRTIVDEVYTGFGRSGEILLSKKYGIKPDMICLGKGMAAGLPIGAVLYNGEWNLPINQVISMQGGNMFVARVAIEVLKSLTEERLEFVRKKGKEIVDKISKIKNDKIISVRGIGFMIGVEFARKDGTPLSEYAVTIRNKLFDKGVACTLVGAHNNVLKISPPVLIDEDTLNEGLEIIYEVLEEE